MYISSCVHYPLLCTRTLTVTYGFVYNVFAFIHQGPRMHRKNRIKYLSLNLKYSAISSYYTYTTGTDDEHLLFSFYLLRLLYMTCLWLCSTCIFLIDLRLNALMQEEAIHILIVLTYMNSLQALQCSCF